MSRSNPTCLKVMGITAIKFISAIWLICLFIEGCTPAKNPVFTGQKGEVKLIIMDPGDFHASLVHKNAHFQIDSTVYVYAPPGNDLDLHLFRIESFNKRKTKPTNWNVMVYKGADFKAKMLNERKGNLVILAGNNSRKPEHIKACIEAGLNVFTSNPMIIEKTQFNELREAFSAARNKEVLLYEAMTERYEITNMLQKDLSQIQELFGQLEKGSAEQPAVIQEKTYYFYKKIAGLPVVRPTWFFDVSQRGNGLANEGSDLADLVQWQCFPQQIINYEREITLVKARHWATPLSLSQLKQITLSDTIPSYLLEKMQDTNMLILANGEIVYKIKGVFAKIMVKWQFDNKEEHGDLHFSLMRGTRANLIIRQGKKENYRPTLYIEPIDKTNEQSFAIAVKLAASKLKTKYKNLSITKQGNIWEVKIPDIYKAGYERRFEQVVEKYLRYLKDGSTPEWEIPNMLAKYYTITKALNMATMNKPSNEASL